MWRFVRSVFAAAGLLVSLAGLSVFASSAAGVWWAKAEAGRHAASLAGRVNAAADAADHGIGFVREVLAQAEQDLARARASTAAVPAEPVNPLVRFGARHASQELAGSVDRATAAVATASDAVVVANTALELFDKDSTLQNWFRVRPEQLEQTRVDLNAATRDLKKARTVLGIPVAPGGAPTADQLNTIEAGLTQARELTDRMGAAVTATRAKVADTRRQVETWVRRVAIGVTALGVLGAAGQFFAARFCWRVLRGKAA
ncbi:hypothetical protein R5W24_001169 [Gemmata sp. JC717]|uniref:hypothetical protein n=1 Tax=Gemmata algarum TaxID=2975278 RepID=UPI0021BA8CA2|nr:hypothetical protein [Gemmata algarum]MDY3552089.1 hypothetical protein [Gemmata algarum]